MLWLHFTKYRFSWSILLGDAAMFKTLNCAIATAAMLLASAAVPAADATSAKAEPKLTIYHIEGRRSERIVWLCEELGLPYKLEFKRGDVAGSMQTIRGVSPLMSVAPTVRYGDQVMVESGAIIELILARDGKGRLAPAVNSPDYPYYLQWLHFAEGSLAARVIADYRVALTQGNAKPAAQPGRPQLVDGDDTVKFADEFLGRNPYFGGKEFSAADIIMLFPITIAESFGVTDLTPYKNVVAWRTKVMSRPAYKKMLQVARPDGVVPGAPRPLPKQ
jgi:glutathione S-transferase